MQESLSRTLAAKQRMTSGGNMKAIRIFAYGGPEVLQLTDIPIPDCGPGDLLVRVVAAGINPLDWKLRAGAMAGTLDKPLPFTPGLDAAGVVVALGGRAACIPPGLSFVDAAALPTPGQAAWTALVDMARLQPGNSVLIHGAAGAVGGVAVQLAKQLGAYVVAMASAHWWRSTGRFMVHPAGRGAVTGHQHGALAGAGATGRRACRVGHDPATWQCVGHFTGTPATC